MKVEMTEDLKDLYETGQSKRYKDVSRNGVLLAGFVRAVKIMEQVPSWVSIRIRPTKHARTHGCKMTFLTVSFLSEIPEYIAIPSDHIIMRCGIR